MLGVSGREGVGVLGDRGVNGLNSFAFGFRVDFFKVEETLSSCQGEQSKSCKYAKAGNFLFS